MMVDCLLINNFPAREGGSTHVTEDGVTMQKHILVSIYDRATEVFSRPEAMLSRNSAMRGFSDRINEKNGPMSAHADDFDLYLVGGFDDSDGLVTNLPKPELIVRGKDVLRG